MTKVVQQAMKRRYARLWIPLALSAAAGAATLAWLGSFPGDAHSERLGEPTLRTPDSLALEAEVTYEVPEDSTIYETLSLDFRAVDRSAPAPCDGCLDESGAIDIAWEYLRDNGFVRHTVDLRAELKSDFPWRGTDGLRYRITAKTLSWEEKVAAQKVWPDPDIEYVAEDGVEPRLGISDPAQDLTWWVWYPHRWTSVQEMEAMIAEGALSMEALSWPPQTQQAFLLIHAETRTVIAPYMVSTLCRLNTFGTGD